MGRPTRPAKWCAFSKGVDGVHLPLSAFDRSYKQLLAYTETAERLGFQAVSENDHLVYSRPWLDGPTALASVLARTGRMSLVTSVALPVVRGPVPLAKSLAAIDLLSCGRLIIGVGPGSSTQDYASVYVVNHLLGGTRDGTEGKHEAIRDSSYKKGLRGPPVTRSSETLLPQMLACIPVPEEFNWLNLVYKDRISLSSLYRKIEELEIS